MNEGPYSWTSGPWAEMYPCFFFFPSLALDCTNCTGLSTHAVFSDKAKPAGPGRRAVSGRLDYAARQTERGAWRHFSRLITAGPLQAVCLPSSSRALPTELLPCSLAVLKNATPPGLTERSAGRGREDKEGDGRREQWEATKDRKGKEEKEVLGRDKQRQVL